MFNTKLILSALGLATVFSTSHALADFDGGYAYRCQEAQQQLASAQAGLNQAVLILSQVGNICGGALPCIVTAQNAYNQAVVAVQNAQTQVNYSCAPRGDGDGYGRGGWGDRGDGDGYGRGGWGDRGDGRGGWGDRGDGRDGRGGFPGRPGPGPGGFPGRPGFGGGFQGPPQMIPAPGDTQYFPPVTFGQ